MSRRREKKTRAVLRRKYALGISVGFSLEISDRSTRFDAALPRLITDLARGAL
jgi:hypothetical protein